MTATDIIKQLRTRGFDVTAEDLPGLYRIDGGPALTVNQLRQIGERLIAAAEDAPAMEWVRPDHFILWN